MDPDRIVKTAPELLKHGAELVGALKLTEIAKTILGPATGEFAERVRDEIKLYRFGRQLELLKKAEKMVQDAGFTPKAVPIKLLFRLLEGASLEENDDLHTMWSALLANAADPRRKESVVHPSHLDILKQLTPNDAAFLAGIYNPSGFTVSSPTLSTLYDSIQIAQEKDHQDRFSMAVDNFLRLHLLGVHYHSGFDGGTNSIGKTTFGNGFIEACRRPKPKP